MRRLRWWLASHIAPKPVSIPDWFVTFDGAFEGDTPFVDWTWSDA